MSTMSKEEILTGLVKLRELLPELDPVGRLYEVFEAIKTLDSMYAYPILDGAIFQVRNNILHTAGYNGSGPLKNLGKVKIEKITSGFDGPITGLAVHEGAFLYFFCIGDVAARAPRHYICVEITKEEAARLDQDDKELMSKVMNRQPVGFFVR